MEASNLGTPSKCIIILLHAVHDCPNGRTTAIARHVSFAQITCLLCRLIVLFIVTMGGQQLMGLGFFDNPPVLSSVVYLLC